MVSRSIEFPRNPGFSQGAELYGLWECRQALRDPEVLLVEGYMDVVGLSQAGVPEACAALHGSDGRPFEKFFRLAPEVVLCFDGDAAGRGLLGRRRSWPSMH